MTAALLAIGAALAVWLGGRQSALSWAAAKLSAASGGALTIEGASGSLYGAMRFEKLAYRDDRLRVTAEQVAIRWAPLALLRREIRIETLAARDLRIVVTPGDAPVSLPAHLRLPLAVTLERVEPERLDIGQGPEAVSIRALSAAAQSDGRHHRLQLAQADTPWARVSGEAQLDGMRPFRLNASVRLSELGASLVNAVVVQASGDLEMLVLTAVPQAPWGRGELRATLSPFEASPLRSLTGQLQALDLAKLRRGLPVTEAEIRFELNAVATGMAGSLEAVNRAAGSLDRGRLPLSALRARLAVEGKRVTAREIVIALGQAGEAVGDGAWHEGRFELRLATSGIKLDALHGRLRPLKPAGKLMLGGTLAAQSFVARFRQDPYALDLEARHDAGAVQVSRAVLSHHGARMEAVGRIGLEGPRRFEVSGKLRDFDPSAFMSVPPARINATLQASGQLDTPWSATIGYRIADSAFRGQPLAGEGQLHLAAGRLRIPHASLQIGQNRIAAQGAFGASGDQLRFTVAAAALGQLHADYGGSLSANGWVGGTLEDPAFGIEMEANAFRLGNALAVGRMTASAEASGRVDAPLALRWSARELAVGGHKFTEATLVLHGPRRDHAAQVTLRGPDLAIEARVRGALMQGPAWTGRIETVYASQPYPVRLSAPVDLNVTPRRLTLGAGQLEVAGGRVAFEPLEATREQLRWHGRAEGLPLAALAPTLAKNTGLQISLVIGAQWAIDASTTLNGMLQVWRERGDIVIPGGRPMALGISELRVDARSRDNVIEGRLAATGARIGQMAGTFKTVAQRDGALWRLAPDAPLALNANVDILSVAWIGPLIRAGVRTEGSIRGTIAADGTLRHPGLRGSLRGEGLALRHEDLGLNLEDGEAQIDFDAELVRLRRVAFRAGEGTIEVTGTGRAVNGAPVLDLDVQATRATLIQRVDQLLVASGSGKLRSDAGKLSLTGRFQADRGLIELESFETPTLSDDVVIVGAPVPEGGAPVGLAFDLDIDFGKAFRIRGEGLAARLAGGLRVVSSGPSPVQVKGTVRVAEGTYRAYGQTLLIERGTLLFDGSISNPKLDILAVRKSPTAEAGVAITGTALSPRTSLYSNPPVPDHQKLAWLVLGPGTAAADTDFGFSTFRRDQQAIALGTQLTSAVYVSVGRTLQGTGNVARVTMMLSEKWAIQAITGSNNGVNLVYTLSFD